MWYAGLWCAALSEPQDLLRSFIETYGCFIARTRRATGRVGGVHVLSGSGARRNQPENDANQSRDSVYSHVEDHR
jgi:hypothetical protein